MENSAKHQGQHLRPSCRVVSQEEREHSRFIFYAKRAEGERRAGAACAIPDLRVPPHSIGKYKPQQLR